MTQCPPRLRLTHSTFAPPPLGSSPVLTSGGFPVVDGVITSFDSIEKVTLAKHGLAPLLAACKATGTCESVRNLFLGDDRKYIA